MTQVSPDGLFSMSIRRQLNEIIPFSLHSNPTIGFGIPEFYSTVKIQLDYIYLLYCASERE